jgi:hypothetical protein
MTTSDQYPVNEWNSVTPPIGGEVNIDWRAIVGAPPSVMNPSSLSVPDSHDNTALVDGVTSVTIGHG